MAVAHSVWTKTVTAGIFSLVMWMHFQWSVLVHKRRISIWGVWFLHQFCASGLTSLSDEYWSHMWCTVAILSVVSDIWSNICSIILRTIQSENESVSVGSTCTCDQGLRFGVSDICKIAQSVTYFDGSVYLFSESRSWLKTPRWVRIIIPLSNRVSF